VAFDTAHKQVATPQDWQIGQHYLSVCRHWNPTGTRAAVRCWQLRFQTSKVDVSRATPAQKAQAAEWKPTTRRSAARTAAQVHGFI
jgi:hypothetical protein